MFQGLHFISETAMVYPAIFLGTFWKFLRIDYYTRHSCSASQTNEVGKFYKWWDTLQSRSQDQTKLKL
jgi:hypothetical protein